MAARASRIAAVANGGQILLSDAAYEDIKPILKEIEEVAILFKNTFSLVLYYHQ